LSVHPRPEATPGLKYSVSKVLSGAEKNRWGNEVMYTKWRMKVFYRIFMVEILLLSLKIKYESCRKQKTINLLSFFIISKKKNERHLGQLYQIGKFG
jgi:hypothetical protein